jgi:isopentenyl phosphate kinase
VHRAEVPVILLHGAGSFGHPQAARHRIGRGPIDDARRGGVSEVLAAVGSLHAEVVAAAAEAGLRPVSLPLHALCSSQGDDLIGLPVEAIERLLAEGHTPVMSGTLVRDEAVGWRVVSADEIMQVLAEEFDPRLALFATNVDGVFHPHPDAPGAERLAVLRGREMVERLAALGDEGTDVTGAMRGKLLRALTMAEVCPVRIVNGTVRGRVLDALKGKDVVGTRVEAA